MLTSPSLLPSPLDETSDPLRQCLDLNKFVAVPTEGLLVTRALELLENHTYWAGIVFQNLGPDAADAPPHVKYKIRMDIDEVEGTKKLRDRYVPVVLHRSERGPASPTRPLEPFNCYVSMSVKGRNLHY